MTRGRFCENRGRKILNKMIEGGEIFNKIARLQSLIPTSHTSGVNLKKVIRRKLNQFHQIRSFIAKLVRVGSLLIRRLLGRG